MLLRAALELFIESAKKKVQRNTPVATGKTRENYEVEVGEDYAVLSLPEGYFGALVEGRKPRSSSTDTGLASALLDWLTAVGGTSTIPATRKGANRLAWLINKHGTRLWQGKATSNFEGMSFRYEIEQLKRDIGTQLRNELKVKVHKTLKR